MYFAFEWLVRFLAFARKADSVRDLWFVFDSFLVALMVFETWFLSAFVYLFSSSSGVSGLGDASILRIARLMRLSRMARLARLLRTMPELVILVKGMLASTRTVL